MGDGNAAGVSQSQGANPVVIALKHGNDSLRPLHLFAHPQHGAGQAQTAAHRVFDEMRNHFGVGFRSKSVAAALQLGLQRQVVFHDAVMGHGDAAGAIGMGMGIGLRWATMGGPAGVSQAGGSGGDRARGIVQQAHHAAHGLPHLQAPLGLQHGHPGAVVAPVLQPTQALYHDRPGRAVAHVTDDAAHIALTAVRVGAAHGKGGLRVWGRAIRENRLHAIADAQCGGG